MLNLVKVREIWSLFHSLRNAPTFLTLNYNLNKQLLVIFYINVYLEKDFDVVIS